MAEGVFYSTGKRKTAVARVFLKPGQGQITINKRPFEKYMVRESDRMLIMEPLKMNGLDDQIDINATVRGGGFVGQAGAIRHGISQALVSMNSDLREALKKAGFLTRDSRIKERKKYGQRGARARFQYSKR
jgi:small subunit ribosomal protein S9